MVLFEPDHLRSHEILHAKDGSVESGALSTLASGSAFSRAWETETNNFDGISGVLNHDIVQLKLPVSKTIVVDVFYACKHLAEKVLGNRLCKGLLTHVLHQLVPDDSFSGDVGYVS